jgi:hypothetical protein
VEPIGTLRERIGMFWIWLHCRCGHAAMHDPADLADKLGFDYPLKRLVASARCRRCGASGATLTIQPPHRTDGTDRPRRVAGINPPIYAVQEPRA